MTFQLLNRRTHLYLGLALLPWFFMYGVSSIPFAHNQYFVDRDAATGLPLWSVRESRTVEIAVSDDEDLRAIGERVLAAAGLDAPNFGASRPNRSQITVNVFSFRGTSRVIYRIDEQRLTIEDRRFRWDHFLTGMHARGGFAQEGLLQTSWSLIVDLVCLAFLVWIASGLYMWWGLRGHRGWGLAAILAGAASFILFTLGL